ncbi:MAG: hypothetical protein RL417_2634 [Pseudomonadota bacterium]
MPVVQGIAPVIVPRTRRSDLILALFVVAITAMLLVPLPTPLLDVLLAANISFALLLLLVGLYMPNALALLAFPSLLLLTTLFRLALNVASTRLILSQGDAGRVIEAFGTFLIRGEVVVGVIIFTIITVVNFIVIARGASRVSEVAARFALDALPGKQMAIDSDLRAGLLRPEEAQRRREDLRKESQLYGAMDGAMKFVQGDVVAGFFIILTNIVGGLYLGMSGGMGFSDAVQTYTVLTVGDGLVTQIPALLISICAGIVVTRVSSGENTTLGTDVGSQLFTRPGTVLFSGAVLFVIAALPGVPTLPFLLVGLSFVAAAFVLARRNNGVGGGVSSAASDSTPLALVGGRGAIAELEGPDEGRILMVLDGAVLSRLYRGAAERCTGWWRELQADFYADVGIRLPELVVSADERMIAGGYRIVVNGTTVEEGVIPLDVVLIEVSPDSADVLGLEVVEEVEHPLTGQRVFWARQTGATKAIADAANLRFVDFFGFLALRTAAFLQQNPEEIFTLTEMHALLKMVEGRHPGLLADVFKRNFVNVARFTEIFQELVREGVNVREYRQIIEAIATYCSRYSSLEEDEFDLHEVVAFVRVARRRQFVSLLLSPRRTLRVVTLDGRLERLLESAAVDAPELPLAIEPDALERFAAELDALVGPVRQRGLLPIAVLCSRELRHKVLSFMRTSNRRVKVVTFEELDPAIGIEPVGVWGAA